MNRILLVDDDAYVLRGLTRVLTRAGFAVTACASSTEASALVRAGTPFNVLLVDYGATPAGGLDELLEGARRVNREARMIVITGAVPEGGLGSQAFDIIMEKPVRSADLLAAIRRLLELSNG